LTSNVTVLGDFSLISFEAIFLGVLGLDSILVAFVVLALGFDLGVLLISAEPEGSMVSDSDSGCGIFCFEGLDLVDFAFRLGVARGEAVTAADSSRDFGGRPRPRVGVAIAMPKRSQNSNETMVLLMIRFEDNEPKKNN
jgi:hypothetical protein